MPLNKELKRRVMHALNARTVPRTHRQLKDLAQKRHNKTVGYARRKYALEYTYAELIREHIPERYDFMEEMIGEPDEKIPAAGMVFGLNYAYGEILETVDDEYLHLLLSVSRCRILELIHRFVIYERIKHVRLNQET